MIQRSKLGLKFFPRRFRRHVYLRDLSIVVMRDILQSVTCAEGLRTNN